MGLPHPKPDDIKHLSASSIADFIRCSMAWYGSRIAKWTQEPVSVMEVGTATHKALSAYHEGKDHELALLAAWKEMACPAPSGSLARVIRVIEQYRKLMQPHEADVVAWWFSVPIPGVPVPLVGEFDLVRAPSQEPDHGLIVDWKSGSGRSWTQQKADSEIQPTAYYMGYQHEAERLPEKFVYWVLGTTAGNPLACRPIETRRTQDDIDRFTTLCQVTYARMLYEAPEPTCPPGWCRFPEQCGRPNR